jgi:hypothetical protein
VANQLSVHAYSSTAPTQPWAGQQHGQGDRALETVLRAAEIGNAVTLSNVRRNGKRHVQFLLQEGTQSSWRSSLSVHFVTPSDREMPYHHMMLAEETGARYKIASADSFVTAITEPAEVRRDHVLLASAACHYAAKEGAAYVYFVDMNPEQHLGIYRDAALAAGFHHEQTEYNPIHGLGVDVDLQRRS